MSEWQPIETAPKDETPVLLWANTRRDREYSHWIGAFDGENWRDEVEGHFLQPTHWMPLPDPPAIDPRSSTEGVSVT